jgi:hypothetical protein
MGTQLLNEYQITFADNHSEIFMAANGRAAMNARETDDQPVAQLHRVKTGIGVETPIRPVKFRVTVLPDTAETSGCHVAPATWVVPEGAKVIFTAMSADGFQFDGWFPRDSDTPLSTEEVAVITIDYPMDPGELFTELEARFSPVT